MLFLTPPLPLPVLSSGAFSCTRTSPRHHYGSLYLMALTRNIECSFFFKGNIKLQRKRAGKDKNSGHLDAMCKHSRAVHHTNSKSCAIIDEEQHL